MCVHNVCDMCAMCDVCVMRCVCDVCHVTNFQNLKFSIMAMQTMTKRTLDFISLFLFLIMIKDWELNKD